VDPPGLEPLQQGGNDEETYPTWSSLGPPDEEEATRFDEKIFPEEVVSNKEDHQ
jgi:hypothetical protein